MAKILLVEDNEMNRDMLSRRLERKGYEVEMAVDGRQGVDKAKTLAYDPATKTLPIIALTAHAMSGDREKALEAGCNDYDTKPIELSRLLGKMEALLGGAAPAGEPGGA